MQSTFTYDTLNRVTGLTASGGKTFAYDSQNEMMAMSASGTTVSLIYDAFGNRVGKSVSGVVTRYLVDDLNPTGYPQVMEELNGSGAVTRTYTYGLQRIDEEQVISSTWAPSFYGYDGGGNVRTLTNSAGAITDSYEYDAFGNSFATGGTTPNNYLYRGEQFDTDLGLYYLRARYYNPLTGRFMSRDPNAGALIAPASLHKYLYANGDPVNLGDPRGTDAGLEEGEIGTYDDLQVAAKAGRNGLENHHIIPQSLKCLFMVSAGKMLAIALTPEVHQYFDNEWNDWWDDLFGSGTKRCSEQIVTLEEVFEAAEEIYADDPDILAAVRGWLEALSENSPSLF